MRKTWLLFLALILSTIGFTQGPPMGAGGAGRTGRFGGGPPSIGHFYGKIIDGKTGKGMDGASVQLILTRGQKDTVIGGMITGRHGDFSLENLPIFGNFKLHVTAIGFKTVDQKVAFDLKGLRGAGGAGGGAPGGGGGDGQPGAAALQALNAVDKDLGNIKLTEDAQNLEQVTVTASKPLMTMGVDRKIYNVEKDISAAGGSATDVMKNVPSVQVDIDGNVTLRNSPPTIFVDGRPTTLTLDQIPADAIQSVEIITNPGAKFDASGGTAGILNIVLKKNRKAGYNGNVRAGVDQRGKFNLGGDINVKQNKVNFFLSGNYNQRKSIATGQTDRTSEFPAVTVPGHLRSAYTSILSQADDNVNKGYFMFGRGGLDYLIDNRNTLSLSGNIVHGTFEPHVNTDILTTTDSIGLSNTIYTRRLSTTSSQFNNHGAMLSFKHTFPKAGEEWTADVNYSQGSNDNYNLIQTQQHTTADKNSPSLGTFQQQQTGNGDNKYFTAQTDFVLPINERSKFEAGGRIAIRNNTSVNNIDTISNGQFVTNQLLSSNYTFRDRVFAGYVTYSNAVGNFTYQLGLRGESSDYNGTEHFTNVDTTTGAQFPDIGHFKNSFPISLFPSVFLTQKLGGDQDLSFNYTRRIDRPNFFQLFPFTDYSDSLNLSRGNPNLQPQFTNSFEAAYQKTYSGNNTFLASVYYKSTTNLITRYQQPGINPVTNLPVFINTFINAKSSFVGGLELIGRNSVTKWWDLTTSVNIFTSHINTIDTGKNPIITQPQSYSWFGKINNSFKLFKGVTFQLSGDYTSKTVLPPGGSASNGGGFGGGRGFGGGSSGNAQGYTKPTGGVDAAVRFEFLKNRTAALTLSVNDIFRTRINDVFTTSTGFEQEYSRRRDPQFFRLQFNWRFGKFDMALFKRKNLKGERDNMENMQGGGGQQQ